MNEQFLTGNEVVEILRISKETLKSWRNSGKIQFTKISPKKFLYRKEDVEQILKGDVIGYKRFFLVSQGCILQLTNIQPLNLDKVEIIEIVFRKDLEIRKKNLKEKPTFSLSAGEGVWIAKIPFNDLIISVEATPDLIQLNSNCEENSKEILIGIVLGERM